MNLRASTAERQTWTKTQMPFWVAVISRRQVLFSFILAVFAAVMSLSVLLLGWGMNIESFLRLRLGFPAMVPETALSLLAGSIGVAALTAKFNPWIARFCAMTILAGIVAHYWRPLLITGYGADDAMSIATAGGLICIAASLALRTTARFRAGIVPQVFDSVGVFASTAALIGYLFEAGALTDVAGFGKIALHTALGLFIIQLALLSLDRDRGWVGILFGTGQGGQLVRKVLPNMVGLAILGCFMALWATEMGWLTANFRLALLATSLMVVLIVSGVILARQMTKAELLSTRLAAAESALLCARHADEVKTLRATNYQSLGQLATGVAQDFNKSLTVVRGNIELSQTDTEHRDGYIEEALDASMEAEALVTRLLSYGRSANPTPQFQQPETVTRLVVDMLRHVTPANIDFSLDFQVRPDNEAELDLPSLECALLNLAINARDALPSGGQVTLSARAKDLSSSQAGSYNSPDGLPAGHYLVISVQNSDLEMDAETSDGGGESSATIDDVGNEAGPGLEAVMGFCRQSGGGIRLKSDAGHGTIVSLALPIADEDALSDLDAGTVTWS